MLNLLAVNPGCDGLCTLTFNDRPNDSGVRGTASVASDVVSAAVERAQRRRRCEAIEIASKCLFCGRRAG